MEALRVVLWAIAALIVMMMRHWLHYPGTFHHAFHPDYESERQQLRERRRGLRAARRDHRAEVRAAEADVTSKWRRVQELLEEIKDAESDDPGDLRQRLGPLALYDRVLKESRSGEPQPGSSEPTLTIIQFPLKGLRVWVEADGADSYLYLARTGAETSLVCFSRSQWSGEDVRRMALKIEAAVQDQPRLDKARNTRLDGLRQKLETARTAHEGAKSLVAFPQQRSSASALKEAEAAVERERRVWEQLTGRLPPQ
ncbi:hypothetical protein ACFVUW_11535 [Streptomyces xiamenensis]|uniref:hypothetical protein n=1 Tax=Streptomyces xiamenensis TaxID=408015 RepID=UPI0036E1E993